MQKTHIRTPLGSLPVTRAERILRMTNWQGRAPLDFAVVADDEQERVRYSEMIDTQRSKTGQTTCLKNVIETEIFKAYRNHYQDLDEACDAYLNGSDPTLRAMVVKRLRSDNQLVRQSGANEYELRQIKKKQRSASTRAL